MKKLGIIGAMTTEVETLVSSMENAVSKEIAGSTFYEGMLEGLPAVIVQCGVGKVNAALCAQILCTAFGVTHLVNTGIAGSLCAQLDIGDLVVSQDAMYHDFDCVHFGYPYGKVPGMDTLAFPANESLIAYAFAAAEARLADLQAAKPVEKLIDAIGEVTLASESAIQAGVVNGIMLEMDGYIEQLKRKYPGLLVFLTGGHSFYFEGRLKNRIFADINLVLIGLNRILEYNVENK